MAHIGIHSVRNAENNAEDLSSYAIDTWFARRLKQCSVPDYLVGKLVTTPATEIYW